VNNILASNLSGDITDEALRGLFMEFGAVERVKIITDRKTDLPTGIAFVQMTDDKAAERAIAGINGVELNGRTLKVNAARPQLHRHGPRTKRA
jgi:cold-inducible RNA-binding protein